MYDLKKEKIIKKTYWYEMFTKSDNKPEPQIAEDITNALWLSPSKVERALKDTYKSIIEVYESSVRIKREKY